MSNLHDIWLKVVKNNDQKAFSVFFDRFYPKLFRFSLLFVKIPSAAEDVVSDVFYNLLKEKKRLKDIKRIEAYLYQAVKNKSLSWLNDQKNFSSLKNIEQPEDYIIEESDYSELFFVDREMNQILENAVSKLPVQRQMVYRLIREDGLFVEEVAELLNLSKRTIEKHLELAVKELCKNLRIYIENQRQHPKIRKIFPRNFIFSLF
jgi:RNA polymerase sigma-70 factor (ECF subfamily)